MKVLKNLSLGIALLCSLSSYAKVIQIIHTNDLHSYFMGTRGGIGGYAQLKTVVDRLRSEATEKGIPTLYLDAGDFGEGSSFYFSNQGVDSLRALDLLGVDVTVLGNHDFILGGGELKNQLIKSKLKATLLSANLKGKTFMGLKKRVPGHVDYKIDDLKVRIFGLTTNEIHYMYPLRPLGHIADPLKTGLKEARKAHKDGADFTIALTHIGLDKDIELVQKTSSIDLVVGGHSHTRLPRPELTKNKSGRLIPILQAGAHSGYVGSMIVDIQGNGAAQMIDYKLYDIFPDMPQDEGMKQFVSKAYETRQKYFGRSWNEIIGSTEIPLSGNVNGQSGEASSCWAGHMARITRNVADAELGLQFEVFQGEQIPPGPVTFGDIVDNFPHFRNWGDKGWMVSRAWISGFVLKTILDKMATSSLALQVTIDGIQAPRKDGRGVIRYNPQFHRPDQALINGLPISPLMYYSLGLPSEVTYGSIKLLNVFGLVLFNDLRTVKNSSYWPLLENYIRENSPLRCLED